MIVATEKLPAALADKLKLFFDLTASLIPSRPISFPDGTTVDAGRPPLARISLQAELSGRVQAFTGQALAGGIHLQLAQTIHRSLYTPDGQRLLDDVMTSIEAECWKHLAERTGTTLSEPTFIQVFISYRKRPDIEHFAEAVANRLAQESIRPRFDKWDMVAGDSLAGKIEEAFSASRACLIILSAEFTTGKWATTEMHTAITKRVNENYRVIPILFEACTIPELLKDPIRVDFSDHNPDLFEARMREIVQGVFGLTRRPFISDFVSRTIVTHQR